MNYLRANPFDATLGPPPWPWLGATLAVTEPAYCEVEQAFFTAAGLFKDVDVSFFTHVYDRFSTPWGAPNDLNTFMAMVNNVPADWHWSAFAIGRNQMPYVAASVLAGGNVRVGLEDNLWLEKGVLATNAQLVERAVSIITNLGARVITPAEVRAKLKLEKRAPLAR